MSSTARRATPAQIRRARVVIVISQALFMAWIVTSILHAPLPSWAEGPMIWIVVGVLSIIITWPALWDREASKKLQSPFMRILNVVADVLMVVLSLVDHDHLGLGVLGVLLILNEWWSWHQARRKKEA